MIAYFGFFYQQSLQHPIRPTAAQILKKSGLWSLLITDLTNILYLTGMRLSAGCVLLTPKETLLFVDSRYKEAAEKFSYSSVHVRPIEEFPKVIGTPSTIGIEADQMSLSRFGRMKMRYKKARFIQTAGIIEGFRRSKYPDELRCIKKACAITKAVLALIPTLLKPEITETALAWQLETESRSRGADGMAFDSIVAFAEHTASPHHHPTDRKLRLGDLVQIDMGARYQGYASDYSRVFFTGTPTSEQKKAMKALRESKKAAEKLVAPGMSNRTLDQCARKILKTYGFEKEFSHSLGHGLGLDIHEGITLSMKAPLTKLVKNEVITIEPGLYFEGRWGMRIEDTIIV